MSPRIIPILIIYFIMGFCGVQSALVLNEEKALGDLVNAFIVPPSGWSDSDLANACEWQGIVCDPTNTSIYEISLVSNGQGDILPDTIGNLLELRSIMLDRLGFRGPIPDSFFTLNQLTIIIFTNNKFTGNLTQFTGLNNLEQLYLSNNSFVGPAPVEIIQMPKLVALALDQNNITGTLPANMFTSNMLQHLNLAVNKELIGTIPEFNAPALKYLALSSNPNLNGTIPQSLSNMIELQELYLNNLRRVTGTVPDLTNLVKLINFNMDNTPVPGCFNMSSEFPPTTCSLRNTLLCCNPLSICDNTNSKCNGALVPTSAPNSVLAPTSDPAMPEGLSTEATIAIAVVIPVVGVAVGVFLIVFFVKKKKKGKKNYRSESELPGWLKTKKTTNPKFELLEKEIMKLPQKMFTPYEQLTVKNLLGVGSFGQVFEGEWQKSKVALKISLSQVSDSFIDEIKLVADMRPHPNIVQLLGFSIHPDSLNMILIMEFCNEGSLDVLLFDSGQDLPNARKLEIAKGIALGLNHLHSNGIIHRDIAARNILLSNGVPKLSDFGMSRQLSQNQKRGTTKGDTGPVRWMAPESLQDQSYSSSSDVWMFGILMFEVFARSEPHTNEDPLEVGIKIRNEGYTPSIPEDVPSEVRSLMKKCWNSDADQRPTMSDIITQIESIRL